MRPSATIISIVLFAINALFIYFWLFDTQTDLRSAEVQIRKQAFAAVKQKIETDGKTDERLNPHLQKAFQKPVAAKRPQPQQSVADASKKDMYEEIYASFVEGNEEGMHLWCRPGEAQVLSFPARCIYSGNCFRCDEGGLIQPDDPTTNPFCADGQMAKRFDTECCPAGVAGDSYRCPDMPTCLAAESVPAMGCACGGGDGCRYAPTADNPECVCN